MSKTAQRIAEIAKKLPPDAQNARLGVAENLAHPRSCYAAMTPEQLTGLKASLLESGRDEVVSQGDLDGCLDELFAAPE